MVIKEWLGKMFASPEPLDGEVRIGRNVYFCPDGKITKLDGNHIVVTDNQGTRYYALDPSPHNRLLSDVVRKKRGKITFSDEVIMGRLHRVGGPADVRTNARLWWQDGLLHREDGPAVFYDSGYLSHPAEWWWRGVRVNSKLIQSPSEIISLEYLRTSERMVREAIIQIACARGLVKNLEPKLINNDNQIDIDKYGKLWSVSVEGQERNDEWRILEVINATPIQNSDEGQPPTFSVHFLLVPRTFHHSGREIEINTAKDAVAWTYGLTAEEYDNLEVRT